MKQIISASYRDDTPAFHSEAFFEALRQGSITIPTKYGPRRVSLRPEDIWAFVFWTKNPSDHFLQHCHTIRSPWYVQWTITGYGKDIEPNVPDKDTVMDRFAALSSLIGAERTIWRYDPIFISRSYTVERHLDTFRRMAARLAPHTTKVVISFMDEYGKIADSVRRGLLRAPSTAEVHQLASGIAAIAAQHGLSVQTCSEGAYDLTPYGIHEAPCIDPDLIAKLAGEPLPASIRTPGSFRRCQCAVNTDIGQYHRCRHGCLYCYAQ